MSPSHRSVPLASVLVSVWLTSWSVASAAEAVDVSLKPNGLLGRSLPAIEVSILAPIAGFRVALTRNDGRKVELRGGGRPGQVRVLELEQPEGRFTYRGELQVNFPDGKTAAMPLEFETSLFGPMKLTVGKQAVDLERRTVSIKANRDIARAELDVLMDTGERAFDGEVRALDRVGPGEFQVSWPHAQGRVMRIRLRVYDEGGFFDGVELSPWFIDIPHEEVHFETARWAIRDSERPKLVDSLKRISAEVSRYGALAELKLFVVGHTDTVGSTASNAALSRRRAESIGRFFKQGLSIPVLVEGLGEEALRKRTADEVDEAENRRAEYILAIEPPEVRGASRPARWVRL